MLIVAILNCTHEYEGDYKPMFIMEEVIIKKKNNNGGSKFLIRK